MYNSELFISDTINSVISQTHKNWELILIDDCSQDKTLKIVQPFLDKYPNINLIKNNKNSGTAISRNKGINIAKGSFIAFLDADDLWKPEKLNKQISFMKTNGCDVCFSSYELIDEQGKTINKKVKALNVLTYSKLLKSNYVGNLTGIYNTKTLGKIISPNLRKRQDWLLWLKALEISKKPALGLAESLAYYRIRENSISSNKFNLLKYNYAVYKEGLKFSTLKSVYYMFVFLKEHFFIKTKQTVSIDKI